MRRLVSVTHSEVRAARAQSAAPHLVRSAVCEAIGTFVLVLTVGCTVLTKAPLAPLAIGAALMVAVYAGAHVSGAHYNPAVTLAVFVRGRLPARNLVPYFSAQFTGAAAAAGTALFLVDPPTRQPLHLAGRGILAALVAEFVFTFMLAFVVLSVATARDSAGNGFYGAAIGGTVSVGVLTAGAISGGALNPAVAVGATLMGLMSWSHIWIYAVGCFVGGAAAAGVFRFLNPSDA